jgi:membrane protease YdiL (CAAX protease family)
VLATQDPLIARDPLGLTMATDSLPSTTTAGFEPKRATAIAPVWHTVVLIVIVVALSALQSMPQVLTRTENFPSKIPVYAETLAYELLLFGYVCVGIRLRGVSIRQIIGGKWSRFEDVMIDVAAAFFLTCVVWMLLFACAFLLHFSGAKAAAPLLPQNWRELAAFTVLAVTAGFCEEFVFRGYLQRQFLAWTGTSWASVALQAVVFGSAHLYQGWKGVVTISLYGVLFGVLAVIRKSLRPGMLQHAGQDTFSGVVGYLALKYKLLPTIMYMR